MGKKLFLLFGFILPILFTTHIFSMNTKEGEYYQYNLSRSKDRRLLIATESLINSKGSWETIVSESLINGEQEVRSKGFATSCDDRGATGFLMVSYTADDLTIGFLKCIIERFRKKYSSNQKIIDMDSKKLRSEIKTFKKTIPSLREKFYRRQ